MALSKLLERQMEAITEICSLHGRKSSHEKLAPAATVRPALPLELKSEQATWVVVGSVRRRREWCYDLPAVGPLAVRSALLLTGG